MTEQELHDKLTTDPNFAASFIVHNNFDAVKKKMSELGITVSTMEQAFNILINWYKSGKQGAKDQILYVTNVPYLNDAGNQTGGYGNFFKANTTNDQRQKMTGSATGKVDWAAAGLAFASTGLVGLVPFLLGGGSGGTNSAGLTPEQQAAAQAAADAAAAEQARKTRLAWIWGGIAAGVAVIGTILVIALSHKKPAAAGATS